jgi:hypothetical protein
VGEDSKKEYTYTITNKLNGEVVYVGKSVNPELRWKVHKSCVKCVGKYNEKFMCHHIHYYMGHCGIDNFQFDVVSDTNCEAQLIEQLSPMCNVKSERIGESLSKVTHPPVQLSLPL